VGLYYENNMTEDMRKETETREPVEILPENIGEMPGVEAAPLLERAALRTEVLGWGGEFGKGLRENLRGAKAWVESQSAEATKKALKVIISASFVAASLSACAKGPSTPYIPSETAPRVTEVSPTQVPTSTETATATQVPTSTETATATENPAETANPFDRSTFPAEFQKDPATMNEQEQTDYQTFLNAARENFIKNQGLQDKVDQMKVNGKFNLDFLDLMAMFYAQNNPDQLKNPELAKGKDVVVGPAEIREALQEGDTNIVNLWRKPFKDDKGLFRQVAYGWYGASPINPEYQKIITFGVVTEIQHYDYGIYGILGGISSIDSDPNTKILWVIVVDSSNNLYLVPRMVNLAPDFTLSASAGVACRDDTTALNEIPPNMSFGPEDIQYTSDSLYGILGKPVNIDSAWGPFNEWSKATGGKLEFSVTSQCYIKGVPLRGRIQITEPYFSPPTWEELTSVK
jgi:hypothetical protein